MPISIALGLTVLTFLFTNVILLMAGNVMDPSPILPIMAPILLPLATACPSMRCTSAS